MSAGHLLSALVLAAAGPAGQAAPLARYSFEPAVDDRDLDGVPDGNRWERLRGGRYPFYARSLLDGSMVRDGAASLRLEPDGHSVGLLTERLPADRFHDYEVSVWLRTRNLKHGAAAVRVRFLAADGRTILAERQASALSGTSDWRRLTAVAPAPQDLRLAHLRVVLAVEAGLEEGDLDGAAWFDELSVVPRPRLELRTAEPANLFRTDQETSVTLVAAGLGGRATAARLRVTALDGRPCVETVRVLRPEGDTPTVERLPLDLAQPGLYRAAVTLTGDAAGEGLAPFARQDLWLGIVPRPGPAARPADLGVILPADPGPLKAPDLLRRLGCRLAKVPISDRADTGALTRLLLALRANGVGVVGVTDHTDPEARVGRPIVNRQSAIGNPAGRLGLTLVSFDGQVERWQLGADGGQAPGGADDLAQALRGPHAVARAVSLVPGFVVPWSALYPPPTPTEGLAAASIDIGPEVPPEGVVAQLGRPAVPFWTVVHPLDGSLFSREAQLRDLALRVAFSKQAGAERVFVAPFINDRAGLVRADGAPTPALLAWRTITEMLDGRRHLGALPLDTPNALFGDDGAVREPGAVLLVWSDGGPTTLRVKVRNGAQVVGLLGERRTASDTPGEAQVTVDRLPVFVTGVDGGPAATAASFALDPALVEADCRWHVRTAHVTNHFDSRLRGKVEYLPPPGWKVEPRSARFDLAPGASLNASVRVMPSMSAARGSHVLRASLVAEAPRPLDFEARTLIEVDWPGLAAAGETSWTEAGRLALRLTVRNATAERLRLVCFVTVADLPPAESGVMDLPPGRSAQTSFLFGASPALAGQSLRLSIRELAGARFLNDLIPVPPRDGGWVDLTPEHR